MKASRWLSDTLRRLNSRERIVVIGGAAISAVAAVAVLVVLPQARRWLDREDQIAMHAEQLARLESLVEREDMVRDRLAALERERTAAARQLLEGETAAVAASSLQLLLNRYATESRVELDRVDAVSRPADTDGITEIPARISVRGDIYGLVDLLFYLQNGEKLLVVDELRVGQVPAGRGTVELLTASVSLHGYYRNRGGTP
jgi:hypothetical protein